MRASGMVVCLAGVWFAWGSALGQCRPVEPHACTLLLHGPGAPSASPACETDLWKGHLSFLQEDRFADRNGDGWSETVLKLTLDPADGCSCAVFRIEYGDTASGYTVNIGDSPTNDGYGGDESSTSHDAELMIRHHSLDLFAAEPSRKIHTGTDDFLSLEIPDLPARALELEICNQFFRFALQDGSGRWEGRMRTVATGQLFALGPPPDPEGSISPDQPDPYLYAAFNRVIHHRAGAPVRRRFGSGVEKVVVFLNP